MTIHEAYEKYEHLDHLLSDHEWLIAGHNQRGWEADVLFDLWQVVKAHVAQSDEELAGLQEQVRKLKLERDEWQQMVGEKAP